MTRVVSLYFPTWPTDRLRRAMGQSAPSVETPVIMLGRQGNRRLVLATDAGARAAGLRVGMPASKAQVLVPNVQSFDLDAAGDNAALDRMALWSLRYAPIVAADPPDGLIIDTTGTDHLHGGEDAMLEGLVSRMASSGIEARASLTLRFGPELGRRLDQAMGRRSEPFEPARSPELIEVRRAFGEPIGAAETIARYIGKLVAALCEALEAKGLGHAG